jgi:maltooligosyltrehalose trehalohydrolase
VVLHIVGPEEKFIEMNREEYDYFQVEADQIFPGTRYFYQLDGQTDRPDPASQFQPETVHGPSEVLDHNSFLWTDAYWKGVDLKDMILYELHVGTFTPEGTFEAIIPRLNDLKEMGVNAIEIMPISQFPGNRNWGYDGVYPYSVQNSYGTPDQFKKLINECHAHGIAVILDVVYNHMGPEGNYLNEYGPYFTDKYHTPWGVALNYDDENCGPVRDFFANNAAYWLENYNLDGLRLDAIHSVYDMGAKHFWQYTNEKVAELSTQTGRKYIMIAESDLNDTKVIAPISERGFGFSTQWMDDFHHALHALLTGEQDGYYSDFGKIEHLVKALQDGFIHGDSYSEYRRRMYGNSSAGISGEKFVICTQNHDQVGNRMLGDRLTTTLSFEALKLAAATMLLSPYVPMLFMGEEYAEEAPFQYFISHTDKDLVEAVRKGRREEFARFAWAGEAPDPQSEETFRACQLQWNKRKQGKHKVMLDWYKELIHLRQTYPALHNPDKKDIRVEVVGNEAILMERWSGSETFLCFINFAQGAAEVILPQDGTYYKVLDSTEKRWQENGADAGPAPENINNEGSPKQINSGEIVFLPAFSVILFRKT